MPTGAGEIGGAEIALFVNVKAVLGVGWKALQGAADAHTAIRGAQGQHAADVALRRLRRRRCRCLDDGLGRGNLVGRVL